MIKRWPHIGSCHFQLEGLHVCSLSNTLLEEHPVVIIMGGQYIDIVFHLCFWLLTIGLAEACLVSMRWVPSDFLNVCFYLFV